MNWCLLLVVSEMNERTSSSRLLEVNFCHLETRKQLKYTTASNTRRNGCGCGKPALDESGAKGNAENEQQWMFERCWTTNGHSHIQCGWRTIAIKKNTCFFSLSDAINLSLQRRKNIRIEIAWWRLGEVGVQQNPLEIFKMKLRTVRFNGELECFQSGYDYWLY